MVLLQLKRPAHITRQIENIFILFILNIFVEIDNPFIPYKRKVIKIPAMLLAIA
jgi:hypothetical protein